jgi:hypothetical protein
MKVNNESLTQAKAKDRDSGRFKKALRSLNFYQERDRPLFVKKHFQDTKMWDFAPKSYVCTWVVYFAGHVCTWDEPKQSMYTSKTFQKEKD